MANKQPAGTDMAGERDMECTTLCEARAQHLGQRHDRRCDAVTAAPAGVKGVRRFYSGAIGSRHQWHMRSDTLACRTPAARDGIVVAWTVIRLHPQPARGEVARQLPGDAFSHAVLHQQQVGQPEGPRGRRDAASR
jgi:hypothetical protein